MDFPKWPTGSVYFDAKLTKQRVWCKFQLLLGLRNALTHLFLYSWVNTEAFCRLQNSSTCPLFLLVAYASCTQMWPLHVVPCRYAGRWLLCVFTCPAVMAPPYSRASRQLRAEVRTAAAVRPACHTRLGSRMLHRNFSASSQKRLEGSRELRVKGEHKKYFLGFVWETMSIYYIYISLYILIWRSCFTCF